jgi:Metallo-peptidase family M12B Reprolysin-like
MPSPLTLILLLAAVLVAAFALSRMRPEDRTDAGARTAEQAATQTDPTPTSSDPTRKPEAGEFAAKAADYELDAPRRRTELGEPLPFREAPFSKATAQLLSRAQRGNVISLELFPGVAFTARITGRWDDHDETRIAAQLDGHPESDRLFMTWKGAEARGLIELPSRNLAYEILATTGGYVAREWLFTDVVCATPSREGGSADRGIPRPSGMEARAFASAASVPVRNSRPDATAVIYLDFDGETVSGTAWDGGRTIVAPAARLNTTQINEVWERVVRDFEIFDVNVTTSRAVHDAAPLNRRTHCIVTSNDQAAPGAGGVAYVASFTESTSTRKICWVFMDTSAKSCAEAASHEIGHTLGLAHDGRGASGGQPREEYYEGHGSGATGWAPIMGVGYYRQLTQWSRGEYARANNTQDDVAIMGENLKIPLLNDDHGSKRDTVSNVTGDRAEGLAERRADFDYFRVDLPAGAHSIYLQPAAFTNLDLELQVENGAGGVLATSNPAEELAATATFTLAAPQTVFLRVDGKGKGDPAGTGYSDYASLGLYYLSGFGNQQLPPSAPIGVSTRRVSGSQIVVSWTPNPSATSYHIFRDGMLLATIAGTEFLDAAAQPSTSYDYTVTAANAFGESPASSPATVTSPAFEEFIMDGEPDFAGYRVSDTGMVIYAAVRGTKLYVATWSPGNDLSGFGSDHHLFVSDTLLGSATTPAPWAKSGFLAIPGDKPYLAGEHETTYAGWFNTKATTPLFKSPVNSGAMEGVIDLVAEFGRVPDHVYVAAVAYANPDGGGINSQAPAGNGNNNLEPNEFLRIPVSAIVDRKLNGVYDILDAERSFAPTDVSFNPSNRVVLRWPTVPGKSYAVQSRDALDAGSWRNRMNTNSRPSQWEIEFTDTNAPTVSQFYRITQPQ